MRKGDRGVGKSGSRERRNSQSSIDGSAVRLRAPRGSKELARPLLAWFSRSRRDLPWRTEPRDPYRTWLSEVMLQQTRVEAMVPYYLRFLDRFPTLESLGTSPLDEVLALWSGLGYYARARNLHRAAREAWSLHGALPRTSIELSALPGFGPYTSAAVASLAYGEDIALVDGNVARVLARIFGLAGDVDRAKDLAWQIAPRLLPEGKAGPFNEALMELGATICTPRSPRCSTCPVASSCTARERGNAEETPLPRPRKHRPLVVRAALRLERKGGEILLQRQPAGALFEGMWDLPAIEVADPDPNSIKLAAINLLEMLGIKSSVLHIAKVEQTLTHREMRVEIFSASAPQKDPARGRADLRWTAPGKAALAAIGLSSLARKSLAASQPLPLFAGDGRPAHLSNRG